MRLSVLIELAARALREHGDVQVRGSLDPDEGDEGQWRAVRGKFTDGVVVLIEREADESTVPHTPEWERRQELLRLISEHEAEHSGYASLGDVADFFATGWPMMRPLDTRSTEWLEAEWAGMREADDACVDGLPDHGDWAEASALVAGVPYPHGPEARARAAARELAGREAERAADSERAAQSRVDEPRWRLVLTEDELCAEPRLDYHQEVVDLIMRRDESNNGDMLEGGASLLWRVDAWLRNDGSVELRAWLRDPEERGRTDEVIELPVLADEPLSGDAWACLRCDDHELTRVRR